MGRDDPGRVAREGLGVPDEGVKRVESSKLKVERKTGGETPRRLEMSVKAEMAFDVCWELYREAREVLEAKRGVAALDLKEGTKYSWRQDSRPKLKDWVADFALAGQAALEGPERASRMVMFRLYYLGLAPYERARHFLGLSERGWVNWSEEIRRRCGEEIVRRGMFPPRKYFGGGVRNPKDYRRVSRGAAEFAERKEGGGLRGV